VSQRFHLPPQQSKRNCTPLWIPILIGIIIGLGLGLLLNLTGVIRCTSCSADKCSATYDEQGTQVVQREMLGSMTASVESGNEPPAEEETVVDTTDEMTASRNESAVEPVVESMKTRDANKPIRLQVLNGCGEKGIARRVAPALRKMGFDVRESRNAKNFRHQVSKIYDRSGDIKLAYQVADAVGIDSSLVGELPDDDLVDIDVTIVIGADFTTLNLGMNE